MTRFVYLQDLDFLNVFGGAEQTDKIYFIEGIKRGHDMVALTPQSAASFSVEESDVVILSNITSFDQERIESIPSKTITFTHDSYCRWRLYLPNSDKCLTDCPQYEYWNHVYSKAKLNIFLSPIHYEVHKMRFGEALEPHYLTPGLFDPTNFKKIKGKKRSGYCNVNGLMGFKGREMLVKFALEHPDEEIDVLGSSDEPGIGKVGEGLPKNITVLPPVPHNKLPEFYNAHKYYVELPNTMQPYNKTCIPGKAKVLTRDGWKRIMDITIGQEVLTHTGRYKRVTEVMQRSAKDPRVSIRPRVKRRSGMKDLLVTDNHPVLTARGWVAAKDLMESDYVATLARSCAGCGKPIYFQSEFCSQKCVAKARAYPLAEAHLLNLDISELELGRLIGAVDSEGCISARVDTRGRGNFISYITVTNNNREFLEHLRAACGGFGTIPKAPKTKGTKTYNWWIVRKDEVYTVLSKISSQLIVKRQQAQLVLRMLEALHLPREESYPIGLECYNGIHGLNQRGMAAHANAPRQVLVEVQRLEQKITPSYVYVPIALQHYSPSRPHKVYNLEVEDDHSYVAQGIVVHNCVEAYLCGCEIITNKLMGCTSYDWFTSRESVLKHMAEAPKLFWDRIEEALKV